MVLDTQSVHAAAGVPASTTGRDPAKRVPGRKRGLAVDVLGLVIAVVVLAASAHDTTAGVALLDQVADHTGGTVEKALADQGFKNQVTAHGAGLGIDVHDAVTGRLVKQLQTGPVLAVEPIPSPPGSACVVVEGRDSWSVWDLVSGAAGSVRGDLPRNSKVYVTTTATGLPMVVSMESGRQVRSTVWDPADGAGVSATPLPRLPIGEARFLVPLPARADGTEVVAVGRAGIEILELETGRLLARLRRPDRAGPMLRRACVLPLHGRVLLAASSSMDIQLWNTADGRQLARWETPGTLALAGVPLPDGRTLLASGNPGGVRLWDPLTGELRHTLLTGAPVHALATGPGPTGRALHIHGPAGLATLTLDESLL